VIVALRLRGRDLAFGQFKATPAAISNRREKVRLIRRWAVGNRPSIEEAVFVSPERGLPTPDVRAGICTHPLPELTLRATIGSQSPVPVSCPNRIPLAALRVPAVS